MYQITIFTDSVLSICGSGRIESGWGIGKLQKNLNDFNAVAARRSVSVTATGEASNIEFVSVCLEAYNCI